MNADYINTLEQLADAVDDYFHYLGREDKANIEDRIKALSSKVARHRSDAFNKATHDRALMTAHFDGS